jgi:hypothetical protein
MPEATKSLVVIPEFVDLGNERGILLERCPPGL